MSVRCSLWQNNASFFSIVSLSYTREPLINTSCFTSFITECYVTHCWKILMTELVFLIISNNDAISTSLQVGVHRFGGWNGIHEFSFALRKGCWLFMIFYWFGRFLQPPKITLEYRFWVPQYRHRSCPKHGNWKKVKKTSTDWSRHSRRELQGITGLF